MEVSCLPPFAPPLSILLYQSCILPLIDTVCLSLQLETVQTRFQTTVGGLMTELGLLRQHHDMLLEQLQLLEEVKPAAP